MSRVRACRRKQMGKWPDAGVCRPIHSWEKPVEPELVDAAKRKLAAQVRIPRMPRGSVDMAAGDALRKALRRLQLEDSWRSKTVKELARGLAAKVHTQPGDLRRALAKNLECLKKAELLTLIEWAKWAPRCRETASVLEELAPKEEAQKTESSGDTSSPAASARPHRPAKASGSVRSANTVTPSSE